MVLRDPTDPALTRRVAQLVQQGDLVVLPTETVYGLAVLPRCARGVDAARELKGRGQDHPFTWHLATADDLPRIAVPPDARTERLLQRYWPGPLTVVLRGVDGGTVGARLPAHEFTRAVIAAVGEPLWLTSINHSGELPLCDVDAIVQRFGAILALVVDDGPSPLGVASTVVRCIGPQFEVLREGILSRDEVLQVAAQTLLFVCTGNTCRSPLAAAIARVEVSKALGIGPDALLARGLSFQSAGTRTLPGMPASEGSLAVADELGVDLHAHQSQLFDEGLGRRSTRIYCLGRAHLEAMQEFGPEILAKAQMLQPDGQEIADPFGGSLAEYRRARDQIAAAIKARLPEWLALLAD
ncbi:MAG TPA: Sua5/YciO/YrdC/YwlC family protein [Planctomycetota bacterium]|nr:Sua5/YciO/YrdC/YwlC family protein [Planctomycetota bacterium]